MSSANPDAPVPGQPMLVLGSGSPRRRQLLTLLGLPHKVAVADIDEWAVTARTPAEFSMKAAMAKALAIEPDWPRGTVIICADTIVVKGDKIYGKPKDKDDARQMLTELSGEEHFVITGLAVRECGGATHLEPVKSSVKIRALSAHEIVDYIATGEPMDKAGSYAIQGMGGKLVEQVRGDFFNVVGLPVPNLLNILEGYIDVRPARRLFSELTPERFQALQ